MASAGPSTDSPALKASAAGTPDGAPTPTAGPSGKSAGPDIRQSAARLTDTKNETKARLQAAIELKEATESAAAADAVAFLEAFIPATISALASVPCSLQPDSHEQRLRHLLLETLHRLPGIERARAQCKPLLRCMMAVMQDDNEENAGLALKVIIDLYRALKTELESEVAPFLKVVAELYKCMKSTVAQAFDPESSASDSTGGSMNKQEGPAVDSPMGAPSPAAESQAASMTGSEFGPGTGTSSAHANAQPKMLVKSSSSFKVLTECPIAIVLILQTFRSTVASAIRLFVPLIIEDCLRLEAPQQRDARLAAKAKGEVLVGAVPGIQNPALYADFMSTQVKMMSFLAYVTKGTADAMRPYAEEFPIIAVRLLQDLPPDASQSRKELLVATRHILSTELRSAFISQVDVLLDERVMTGTGITSRETLRPLAISMLADLVHHVRPQLNASQIARIVKIHIRFLHDPTLAPSIQTMCVKLLLNLSDPSVMRHPEEIGPVLSTILEALFEKLASLPRLREDLDLARQHKAEANATSTGANDASEDAHGQSVHAQPPIIAIERAKVIGAGVMLPDIPGVEAIKDARFLFRNLLMGFKSLLPALRRRKLPEPSGEMMGRLFVDGVKCWTLYEQTEGMPDKEVMELFTNIFLDLDPATFHEVFSTHMPFLFERILLSPNLLGVPQSLMSNDAVSKRFVAILFQYLVNRLSELGDADKKTASVTLRLFKMAFMAVTIFPEDNEAVLQPHLSHIIMTSMKLASQAVEPANYFLLLRALFRSIGGGRFELLYKDVLPLLPVLLENLNNLLTAAEPSRRELFVDLCLTVPVRLSVLLPYLGYLMRPLVLALQSSTELVSQGLRTLELCIDNLTQEFLDPIMAPYLQDIMGALWKHLQPLPHNHQHSHTTMRILGKMGGRNRRLLQQPPRLNYKDHQQMTFAVCFDDKAQSMELVPLVELALAGMARTENHYRKHAFELLRHAAALFIDGVLSNAGGEREKCFESIVKALFQATYCEPDRQELEGATNYLLGLSKHIFALETRRDTSVTRQPSSLMVCFMQGVAQALAANDNEAADRTAIVNLELQIIATGRQACIAASRQEQWTTLMHSLASKHCTLCYDPLWQRKTGGWLAIDMMVRRADLGTHWLREHQLEIMRALLYMLKDMPSDPPGNVDAVGETILFVLRTAHARGATVRDGAAAESGVKNANEASAGDATTAKGDLTEPKDATVPASTESGDKVDEKPQNVSLGKGTDASGDKTQSTDVPKISSRSAEEDAMQERQFTYLVGVLVQELSSANSKVRAIARASFELLAELRGASVTSILMPIKDRLLVPIFTKPLRALPFGMQIGHIDAITFCLKLTPPLPEPNEELFRVLTEALALADAEDQALVGRVAQYKNMLAVTELRVVAIRLLASAMACNDFLTAKHNQMRIRIIAVYFKSLYSRSQAVIDEAYHSLQVTLATQPKLPKDVLQSGLRPILMTLADASRLTVAGLDGLARLLELLTSYFKVEIGSKLLVHMEGLADREAVERASRGALEGPKYADAHHLLQPPQPRESERISVLAAIVRIFHLLPSAASQFMEQLVGQVCSIEALLRRSGPTPFTKPLAQYFERYPAQACDCMFSRLEDSAYARCLRLALAEECAPALRQQIETDKATRLLPLLTPDSDSRRTLAALHIVRELEKQSEGWICANDDLIAALQTYWASPQHEQRRSEETGPRDDRISVQILEIFTNYLRRKHNTDLYFAIASMHTLQGAVDLSDITRFVYDALAVKASVADKRAVLARCIDVAEKQDAPTAYKVEVMRLLANPILVVARRSTDTDDSPATGEAGSEPFEPLFDAALFTQVVNRIWKPFQNKGGPSFCPEDVVRIELILFSTMVLEHSAGLMSSQQGARKDAIMFGWANLATDDVTVKTTTYVFISRFLELFDAPIKIVARVYSGLLSLHHSEGRAMVRKALDILLPALPKRVPSAEPSHWAKWTKRQLVEEGNNVSQAYLIFQLIIRHSDLFYENREMFLPHIVGNLNKLGLSPSANTETRTLAVELVDVVARWEQKRIEAASSVRAKALDPGPSENAAPSKRSADLQLSGEAASLPVKRARIDDAGKAIVTSSPERGSPTTQEGVGVHAYVPAQSMREAIMGFLVRFVSLSQESIATRAPTSKAFATLQSLMELDIWSSLPVRLSLFQRSLATTEVKESTIPVFVNTLQTLRLVTKRRDRDWVISNLAMLHRLLERSIASDDASIHENCRDLLEQIFAVLPEPVAGDEDAEGDEEDDVMVDAPSSPEQDKKKGALSGQPDEATADFRKYAETTISEGLRNQTSLCAALTMLSAWSSVAVEKIDDFLAPLTKALTKLTKDHLGLATSQQPGGASSQTSPPSESDPNLLMMVLDLLKLRISNLGEQRRWFLSAVVQLIEKSSSLDLCRFLLAMMRRWILEQNEGFPTVKEKAGILVKMMSFEQRDEALLRDFLDLIHAIYTRPSFARTELTVRLENAFLMGCRQRDPILRQKFIDIFDSTLVRSLAGRLTYLLGTQSWEYLADQYWIQQVLDLSLGAIAADKPLIRQRIVGGNPDFTPTLRAMTTGGLMQAARPLLYIDSECTHRIWVAFFGTAWQALARKSQEDLTRSLVGTLTREHNLRQVSRRPNVVQTLLNGAAVCTPRPELPPQVVKYLGKTFAAWHTAMELLQDLLASLPREDDSIREACQDALSELYAELSEDDLFYGLWRRRCVYAETNAAISYEQTGMWAQAQVMYETAQAKARTGVLTFTEAEYSLWEDHWVICAQKLQQWDILTDLARLEGNNDLLLECAWRLSDWVNDREVLEQALDNLSATSTPRRRVFAAYMALLKSQGSSEKPTEFGRICDEAIQLTLRKWHSLPTSVTQAHVPLLQIFQQLVELQEASSIFNSLSGTNASNLDPKSQELKQLMQTWRERLPNRWDDINAWSDLVAWRQHVFSAVNKAYLPLVPQLQQNGAASSSTNSYAYRGYHETAWIVNRFAHVARKHQLNDVCISSLTKIYQLPNIEIQEAFLKLREQAKCHYRNPAELHQGLEVINNTNLMFFAAPQKAEFFTLKGMFMAKLNLLDDANHAFATAIQMDLNLAKAWTEWGRYNDRMFRDKPQHMGPASSAVSCYLQAAGLYKSAKVRKILIRILWLLSCDDSTGSVAQAFEGYRGEAPVWYWITFIPQLLQGLQHREAKYARRLLMQIAKTFPQSLYFFLRTAREDYAPVKRQVLVAAQRAAQAQQLRVSQQQQQSAKGPETASGSAESANAPLADGGSSSQAETKDGEKPENVDAGTNDGVAQGRVDPKTGSPTPSAPTATSSGDDSGKITAAKPEGQSAADGARPSASAAPSAPGHTSDTDGARDQAVKVATTGADAPNKSHSGAEGDDNSAPSHPVGGSDASTTSKQPSANDGPSSSSAQSPNGHGSPPGPQNGLASSGTPGAGAAARQPWDYIDEILQILKTGFPLLALTLENTAEQIGQRFKPGTEEDIYRLINALLNDALQQYVGRASIPSDPGLLPQASMANVMRFADSLPQGPLKNEFEEDFVRSKPSLRQYVQRLQRWRDNYERFDEVEMPGQYLRLEDNNSDFAKITRFVPTFELTRSSGICTRRISIFSNKGNTHSFAVQLPSARYCRREERILQLLRLLNRVLERRIESRKRGLTFTTPVAIPLSPQLRLVESDASFVSLQDVFERHCEEIGISKEDPITMWVEKMRSVSDANRHLVHLSNLRMDLLDEISTKMVPDTVLTRFITRSMSSPSDLWLLRKQFTLQMASTMFLTYALFISARGPPRISFSRNSGVVSMSDVVPTFSPTQPQFKSNDPTPFRLTPNLQNFITPTGVEGILASSLTAIGRCLSEPERDLEEYLSIFVRDEITFWLQTSQRNPPGVFVEAPRDIIYPNILDMVKRARLMSCDYEASKPHPSTVPVSQTVLDLINSATNSGKLALQEPTWHPWL
ncbi:Histone acetyltransferase SAGA, TRRAP/TRA1 component, PI-3 kinase superfamily [Ceraceosorus bombacis]|uniref:Histone acetyltransferase SAGA, TRRAP/TRA1 component, PI-3 kinase superfamily n=1 Tax=Ceraceosorus bombacis TaxID=401625 RepID=A0A0P1BLT4_9BASI|nr:Histone acetyltransferase SAGA, TRRAP/TRA1 component, PI-3 kinase superfamily [Ceraceosorus bombacis]